MHGRGLPVENMKQHLLFIMFGVQRVSGMYL